MTEREELIRVSLRAAVDLIHAHDTSLTDNAIKTRIERMAEDLLIATNSESYNAKEA